MCERCKQMAEINHLNASAIDRLAEAASTLSNNVPQSDAAIKAILKRIDYILGDTETTTNQEISFADLLNGFKPEPEPEGDYPPELQEYIKAARAAGLEIEIVKIPKK